MKKIAKSELDRLHDPIIDLFDISCTEEQLSKILTLCPDFDGYLDTAELDRVMDKVCQHFIGMDVPTFGSSQDYKDRFWKEIEIKKPDFLKFIS